MRARDERGSTAVEFAVIASIAVLLLLGILDFSYALYTEHLVTDLARMGARYAMVRGSSCTYGGCPATSSSLQTYVQGIAPGVVPTSLTVTTSWSGTDTCTASPYNGPGCLVSVTVSYPYRYFLPAIFGTGAQMSSTSSNVISQ